MSANVIRKEEAAEIGQWEPQSFGVRDTTRTNLPTVDEIDRLHRSAHSEGYQQGFDEGRSHAQAEATRLATLLEALENELAAFDQEIADYVLRFALTLTRSLLRTALTARPELLIPLVRETLAELPAAGKSRYLHLHPLDAELLGKLDAGISEIGQLSIVEDARVERGGCRLRSDVAEIDATLATRWKHALAALGRDDAWITEPESPPESTSDGS
jgi:flagellar assembly protein FliH